MRLSHTITLFSEPEPSGLGSWSYLASILVHGAILALLSYGIIYAPQISDSVVNRYTMRQIELHMAKPKMPAPSRGRHAGTPSGDDAVQRESAKLAEARTAVQVAQLEPGRQTLVRPDLPANLSLSEKTPVPTVVVWTPQKTPVIKIVPPQPQAATAVDVKPADDPPNEALNLADRSIPSSDLSAESFTSAPRHHFADRCSRAGTGADDPGNHFRVGRATHSRRGDGTFRSAYGRRNCNAAASQRDPAAIRAFHAAGDVGEHFASRCGRLGES